MRDLSMMRWWVGGGLCRSSKYYWYAISIL